MLETELRWNFTPRWAMVGFVGVGRAFGRHVDFDEAESIYTRGAGIRYLIARKLGLYTGIDIARGPEETAIYLPKPPTPGIRIVLSGPSSNFLE